MTPTIPNDIVLYWYPYSVYARRVYWYLTLRGIPHASCVQPPILPRADLEALGVNYRRIPLLSIGRDMYLDSRLILRKLEAAFPSGALGGTTADQRALQQLLERWTVDGGVIARAVQLMPLDGPLVTSEAFRKDRESMGFRKFDVSARIKARPEAIVMIRECFALMETTLLADGRDWVFGGPDPSLGDIEGIWVFHWLLDLRTAVPESIISARTFPKVFAWIARFNAALDKAKRSQPRAVRVKGQEVAEYMKTARFAEAVGEVDANDPLGLLAGDVVDLFPIDSGFNNKDRGKLLSLTPSEVVISKTMKSGEEIRVHAQRWGFRIQKVTNGDAKL